MFLFSTQLSMKFQLLINIEMLKNKDFLALKLSDVYPVDKLTIVGILTFMSRINFMLILFEHEEFIKFHNLKARSRPETGKKSLGYVK